MLARDPQGATSNVQSFEVAIHSPGGDAGPSIALRASTAGIEAGQELVLATVAEDDLGIAGVEIRISSPALSEDLVLAVDATGRARFTPGPELAGATLSVVATATDTTGQTASTSPLAVAVVAPNLAAPAIRVTNLEAGQVVEASTPVLGAITDDDDNLVYRSVVLRSADGSVAASSVEGVPGGTVSIAGVGTASADAALLTLNPLTLRNGLYTLEIEAEDAAGSRSGFALPLTLQTDNNVKLGNFALSFTDLSIAVGGIPLTATRSYDTLDATDSLDFGHGWQLDIATGELVVVDPVVTELTRGLPEFSPGLRNGSRIEVEFARGREARVHRRSHPLRQGHAGRRHLRHRRRGGACLPTGPRGRRQLPGVRAR